MRRMQGDRRASESGSALVYAMLGIVVLTGMSAAIMTVGGANTREVVEAVDAGRALYTAEAGASRAVAQTRAGLVPEDGTLVLGTADEPLAFAGGDLWASATDNGDGTVTVLSFADVAGAAQGVELVLQEGAPGIYSSALFAGNDGGDPTYDLEFGGERDQADEVNGNVYSGGSISVAGDATINGELTATASIYGGAGETGQTLPVPDIPGEDYENNHDFDVAASFAADGYSASDSLGGTALQLPEDDPSHIFRLNPSDRESDTSATAKDDYFLEDPYESVVSSSTVDEGSATPITLSGQAGNPGPDGSDKVYYIDGNLWVHNRKLYSFKFATGIDESVRVTFIVKGNIYFSDNILYEDSDDDAVAFLAIEDDEEPDSGNIYFGDPVFGTLEQMDAFMYAENNFYDNNLDEEGSKKVTVNGNMTAGNQVLINRDVGDEHSKLTVNFDDRIESGAITLPGLPSSQGEAGTYAVASWREVRLP